jgi:hypothetical protein
MVADPTGMDGEVTGEGTKDNPYVIHANYYYKTGSLGNTDKKGLNAAIKDYNNRGKAREIDGRYVKFNLTAQEVDDVDTALENDVFTTENHIEISRGNRVEISNDAGDNRYGTGGQTKITINMDKIRADVAKEKYNLTELVQSTFIHEIGHNLSLDHYNATEIMREASVEHYIPQMGVPSNIFTYSYLDNKGIGIMINNINQPRKDVGVLRKVQ